MLHRSYGHLAHDQRYHPSTLTPKDGKVQEWITSVLEQTTRELAPVSPMSW